MQKFCSLWAMSEQSQDSIGWNTHTLVSWCLSSLFRVCCGAHVYIRFLDFSKLQVTDDEMICSGAVGEQLINNKQLYSAAIQRESRRDLSQRDPWFHVFKTGLVLHSAVWCKMDEVWPQCPPGKVQSHHSFQNQSPFTDWHRAWDGGEEFIDQGRGMFLEKNLHIRRRNAPVLLWSYCWKPNMSSERWEKSFSFRALRAEPSAALTLQTHREKTPPHEESISIALCCA